MTLNHVERINLFCKLSIEFTIYKETNVTLVIPAGDDKSEGYHELLWISLIGVEL